MLRAALLVALLLPAPARAGYPWLDHAPAGDLAARFPPPPSATRISLPANSFGDWLRHLPLLPAATAVHLFDGTVKPRQDVHAAVVDLDVGKRDLQQCADAVMRLRAEYLYSTARPIKFHPDPGKLREIAWLRGNDRPRFAKWLVLLFAEAGTASLAAELPHPSGPLQPGDVLIQGGYPGHALLVLDAAETPDGHRYVLLGQSYMPAQQFHVVKNPGDANLSPWYDAADLSGKGIVTPEWRPFHAADVRRFGD